MTAPLTVNDVISRATFLLNDSGNVQAVVAANTRWSVAEMIDWVSDAQRQIVLQMANASNKVAVQSLVVGTRQKIPTDGWLLLGINRNMNADGSPNRAIRQVNRAILDAQNPNWHMDTPQKVAWNFTYDAQDQDAFYIYPPNDGTGMLEMNYSAMPAQLVAVTDELLLDDIFLTPMVDYVCFRALSKDAEYAGGAQLATLFFQSFTAAVSAREESEKEDSPDSTYSAPGVGNFTPSPGGRAP